jgi:hypothetical protein
MFWSGMEKIRWTDHVRNGAVLHRVKEKRNAVHAVKRKEASWIGDILHRNCLVKHVVEGKVEVMGK